MPRQTRILARSGRSKLTGIRINGSNQRLVIRTGDGWLRLSRTNSILEKTGGVDGTRRRSESVSKRLEKRAPTTDKQGYPSHAAVLSAETSTCLSRRSEPILQGAATDAELERTIVAAMLAGRGSVAELLADRLRERMREQGGRMVTLADRSRGR
jgi:hypothetical protein